MRLHLAVQIVALSESADQHDAADHAPLSSDRVHLAVDERYDLFHHRLEDLLDLIGRHDEEARIEAGFFVVWKPGEGDIDFVVLVFVEVALDEFFKVFEAHVPRLGFLFAHGIVPFFADAAFDVVLEAVVQER
jgi:hypothetical protein